MTVKSTATTTIAPYDADLIERAETCVQEPTSALIRIWHARSQHDHGLISSKELAVLERIAGQSAGRARSIYNPFTGELRKAFLPDWVGKHKEEDPPMVGWSPKKAIP